jgi:RNase H-like domain found in reverse transcriptase/Reverse transcriptase (RNA-dependent DNA polymerase)/Integrase zinc binding domain/Integrase core domain
MGKSFEEYELGSSFEEYTERLEQYFLQHDIVDGNKKRATLIAEMGSSTYTILKSLLSPALPSSKTYAELKTILTDHFQPTVNEIAETLKFNRRYQHQGESISEYIVELRSLARTCNFATFLDRQLRDRLVSGVYDKTLQNALLAEGNTLTFESACQKALNLELVAAEQQQMVKVEKVDRVDFQRSGRNRNPTPRKLERQVGTSKQRQPGKQIFNCYNCGGSHALNACPAYNQLCAQCQGWNHFAKMCRTRKAHKNLNQLDLHDSSDESEEDEAVDLDLNQLVVGKLEKMLDLQLNDPVFINILIENVAIPMEVDTGACLTVISYIDYQKYFEKIPMNSSNTNCLQVISGKSVEIRGHVPVVVDFNGQIYKLWLTVLDANFKPLLGRNWLKIFFPSWKEFFTCNEKCNENLKLGINEINELKFNEHLSFHVDKRKPITKFKADLHFKDDLKPIFHKARTPPFKFREQIEKELSILCEQGVLKPVNYSEFASPIVCVPKSDGNVRICGDFKATINKYLHADHYPLPRIDDVLASLAGCSVFCVIDLEGAYQQLEMAEGSKKYVTINTHKGLFEFQRLPFGVSTAPAIFQCVMDQILQNIPKTNCYLDDILIGGSSKEECEQNLLTVIERLKKFNVRINKKKCQLFKSKVLYLGHQISKERIEPNAEKVEAILKAPIPKDVTQLQSFLGLVNYYHNFLPNVSAILGPLYNLLGKDVPFIWSECCQVAFENCKKLLLGDNILYPYDPKLPIVVSCDASSYGVGAVLSHTVDGVERPVMFVSSTLSPAEKNYSQLDREALAVIFALKKFEKYIYGHPITIFTDHKPLESLFNFKKGMPSVATARLQRWMLIVSMYECSVVYKKGSSLQNADALSRLPLDKETGVEYISLNVLETTKNAPVTVGLIARETKNDPILEKVYDCVMKGWPNNIDPQLKKFFSVKDKLSCDKGCLFFENRVVCPENLKRDVLEVLHEGHLGIVRMKLLARSYVWWFGLSTDIENCCRQCQLCAINQKRIKDCPNSYWPPTNRPMERVHADLFHLEGKTFLLIVDSFSKWIDVSLLSKSDAKTVNRRFLDFFSNFGICKLLVTDNGPPFSSKEFADFMSSKGVKIKHSPEYHPESNGLAERAVQTVKQSLKKFLNARAGKSDLHEEIATFVTTYRRTPTSVTGKSPAELMFSFIPNNVLGLMNDKTEVEATKLTPEITEVKHKMDKNLEKTKKHFQDKYKTKMDLNIGDKVWYFLTYKNFNKWVLATIKDKISSLVYLIDFGGHSRQAQRNQLRKYNPNMDIIYVPLKPSQHRNKRQRRRTEPSSPSPNKNNEEQHSPSIPRSKVSKYFLRDCPRKRFNSL